MLVDFKTKDSRSAIGIAVFFHVAVLLLFFLFLNFQVPDPPHGTAEVSLSLADFGMDNTGQGDTETETPSPQVEEVVDNEVSENTTETVSAEEIETQETATITKPSGTATTPVPKEDPKPTVSSGLNNAFENISSNGGGGGDGDDGETGNVGANDGHIDGKGVFSGGDGITGELTGRGYKGGVDTSKKPTEEGTVVVNIYVDRNGNVTRAVIDKKHPQHNTTSQHLWNLAKEQAMTAKFSKNSKATISQKGYIIFRYKLK